MLYGIKLKLSTGERHISGPGQMFVENNWKYQTPKEPAGKISVNAAPGEDPNRALNPESLPR